MRQVGVGVIGFGTVGAGVVGGLQRNRGKLAERLGIDIELRKVADLDIATDRGVAVEPAVLTADAREVVGNPAVDIVVELIGGSGIARELVRDALSAGQSVVTANKKLLAEHGAELFALAEKCGVDLYFGASVGGGIPLIRAIREGLAGNEIESITAILNGTCNYVLTRMETDGLSFAEALAEAQSEGFAEADPTLDVDGYDTLHKAVILALLAYGFVPDIDQISRTGIRGVVEVADIRYAQALGFRIKLLAVIRGHGSDVEVRVAPTLVPSDSMLASVSGVFNAARVESDLAGTTLYYGRGAGRLPTASTVIGDIADVAFNRVHNAPLRVILPRSRVPMRLQPRGDAETRHYLRLAVRDCVGSMAAIARVLAAHGVSLASVLQQDIDIAESGFVPVVFLTHSARRADVDAALDELAGADAVGAPPVRLDIA